MVAVHSFFSFFSSDLPHFKYRFNNSLNSRIFQKNLVTKKTYPNICNCQYNESTIINCFSRSVTVYISLPYSKPTRISFFLYFIFQSRHVHSWHHEYILKSPIFIYKYLKYDFLFFFVRSFLICFWSNNIFLFGTNFIATLLCVCVCVNHLNVEAVGATFQHLKIFDFGIPSEGNYSLICSLCLVPLQFYAQ